jgi:hypothetical protein
LTTLAGADLKLITQSDEVVFGDVRLPQKEGASISYRPCAGCDYVSRRIATDALWQINDKSMTLIMFLDRTAHLNNRDQHSVTVTRHIDSDRITLVSTIIRDSE